MLNPKQLRNTWTASIAQSASITTDNRKRKHGHTYLEQGFSGSHPTTTPAALVVRCASQITQRLALTPRTVPRILPPHRLAPRTLAPPINGVNLKTGTSLDTHHRKQKRVFFCGWNVHGGGEKSVRANKTSQGRRTKGPSCNGLPNCPI